MMKRLLSITACVLGALSACAPYAFGQAPQTAPIQVWASDIHDNADGAPGAPPEVSIVCPRNGAASGKVVVGSDAPIRGLKAVVGELKSAAAAIPAAGVLVRCATEWDGGIAGSWGGIRGNDILHETPLPVFGQAGRTVVPVWVTVQVPKDAKPGAYTGRLTVSASGSSPVEVPVKLDVQDWTLPDTQDYRVWAEVLQQPDTLSAEYNIPPWSEKHWDMIGKSLRLIAQTGSRVIYVPLICRTNYGNDDSMVRWVKKGEGKYEYDYSIMERYLDTVLANMGKPKIVGFNVWEVHLVMSNTAGGPPVEVKGNPGSYEWRESTFAKMLQERSGKGPFVTVMDPSTKELEKILLPRYDESASKALWQPLWDGVRARMKARGLEEAMMLAQLSDRRPTKDEVAFWEDVSGGTPWMSCTHHAWQWLSDDKVTTKQLHGIGTIGYTACALDFQYVLNPAKDRRYGWKKPMLHGLYWRFGTFNSSSLPWIRQEAECNITGNQRGMAHIGGDLWKCFRNAAGRRTGTVTDRFPESYWHSLDVGASLLAPGADGPVSTARMEVFREGLQECEARIAVEAALTDPALTATLGEELASRARKILDERQLWVWRSRGAQDADLAQHGLIPAYRTYLALAGTWKTSGAAALKEYITSGQWRQEAAKLYTVAGEVSRKLGK